MLDHNMPSLSVFPFLLNSAETARVTATYAPRERDEVVEKNDRTLVHPGRACQGSGAAGVMCWRQVTEHNAGKAVAGKTDSFQQVLVYTGLNAKA